MCLPYMGIRKRKATVQFNNSDTLLKAKRLTQSRESRRTNKSAPRQVNNRGKDFSGWESIPALKKLHNLAIFVRSSAIHSDDWRETVRRALGIDNITRWSSWYLVLNVAIDKRDEITTFMAKNLKALDGQILNDEDWDLLEKS